MRSVKNQRGIIPLGILIFAVLLIAFFLIAGSVSFKDKILTQIYPTNNSFASYNPSDANWYKKVQIYGMLPMFPEDATSLGLTMNGLWGGYFWDSPVRQGDFMYASDKEQVDTFHAASQRAAGVIDGSISHNDILSNNANLTAAADKTTSGATAQYSDYAYMCIHNQEWANYQINRGKRAIDAGVDSITIDNFAPFGMSLLIGSLSYPGGTPFTCDESLNAFRSAVSVAFPEVTSLTNAQIRDRLKNSECYIYGACTTKDRILDYWMPFYDEASYNHTRILVQSIKDYAASKGRAIPIFANQSLKGLRLGAQGEYVFDANRYWKLFDVFASENLYQKGGDDDALTPMPRQKLLSLHKLGRAIKGAPNVILHNSSTVWPVLYEQNLKNFYLIHMAEGYANRSMFGEYISPEDPNKKAFFNNMAPLSKFITSNNSLYDDVTESLSDAGLLYLRPMEDSFLSYSGLAQALAESNVQFDVITAYDAKPLTVNMLTPYSKVVVSTLKDATNEQIAVLNDYVNTKGGKLVVYGQETHPNLVSNSSVVRINQDAGSDYLINYSDALRTQIRQQVLGSVPQNVKLDREDRKIVATAYKSVDKLAVHLVNYDHNMATDVVTNAPATTLTLKTSVDYSQAVFMSPDSAATTTATVQRLDPSTIRINIPSFKVYNLLLLSNPSQSPAPSQSSSPLPSAKPGDVDGNNKVDIFDYNLLLTNFGKTGSNIQGDLDKNGKVDIFDYNIVLTNFGR